MSNTVSCMKIMSKLVMKANIASGIRPYRKEGNSVTLVRRKILKEPGIVVLSMLLLVVSHVDEIHFHISPKSYSLVISNFCEFSVVYLMRIQHVIHVLMFGVDLTL